MHGVTMKSWRTFCSSVMDSPRSARLHRALCRDPKIRLGYLAVPTGQRMQSKGETLDLLLATHFPQLVWGGELHLLLPAVPNVWTGG